MLLRDAYVWISMCALGVFFLVTALFAALLVQHAIAAVIARHTRRRLRSLLPLVMRSIESPESTSALKESLQPFDRVIVRNLLMRLGMDRGEKDAGKIVRVYDRLGLLESEIRSLSAFRSRTRRRAVANLGFLRQPAALRPLIGMLDDPHINVRLAVVDALGDIGCEQGLVALIPLLQDPEPAVAWRAQEALCRSGQDVGPQVVEFLERTWDSHARRAAVESLRWLHPRKAEARLCTIARDDKSRLRGLTADALASIGSGRCGAAVHALLYDPSSEVRARAARALGLLGWCGSVPALRAALVDESSQVRRESARTLVEMGESGIMALLEELASRARDESSIADPPAPSTTAGAHPA